MSELIEAVAGAALFGLVVAVCTGLVELYKFLFYSKPPEDSAELLEVRAKVDPQTLREIETMFSEKPAGYNPMGGFLKPIIGAIAAIIVLLVMAFF